MIQQKHMNGVEKAMTFKYGQELSDQEALRNTPWWMYSIFYGHFHNWNDFNEYAIEILWSL